MSAPLVVLDFDGTLCLGHDPARMVAQEADADGRLGLASLLDRWVQGDASVAPGAADGYQAVSRAALAAGLPAEALQAAFLRARTRLAAGEGSIWAPVGALKLLGALRRTARVIIVTNSPTGSTLAVLARLGLDHAADAVVGDAAKPGGLVAAIRAIAPELPSARMLAVGDIWTNDCEPVHGIGGSTCHLSRAPHPAATMHGPSLTAVADRLLAWAILPSGEQSVS